MLIKNQEITLTCEGLGAELEGVGHHEGQAVFMISMDGDILRLYKAKRISRENALLYAINPDTLAKRL